MKIPLIGWGCCWVMPAMRGKYLVAPDGFTLNQILKDIEYIFQFKNLVPMLAVAPGQL